MAAVTFIGLRKNWQKTSGLIPDPQGHTWASTFRGFLPVSGSRIVNALCVAPTLPALLKALTLANSPSTNRQDYFSRHQNFEECSEGLVRVGLEQRDHKAFVPVGLLECHAHQKWTAANALLCFSFITSQATKCRQHRCATGRKFHPPLDTPAHPQSHSQDYTHRCGRNQPGADTRSDSTQSCLSSTTPSDSSHILRV